MNAKGVAFLLPRLTEYDLPADGVRPPLRRGPFSGRSQVRRTNMIPTERVYMQFVPKISTAIREVQKVHDW